MRKTKLALFGATDRVGSWSGFSRKQAVVSKCTFQIFFGGVGMAGSEDFACATLPITPLDFQNKI